MVWNIRSHKIRSCRLADFLIAILVASTFLYMIALTLSTPYPNGRDPWFHILVARAWYRGEIGMVSPVVMNINKIPYAPLYHLLLAPFTTSLQLAVDVQRLLQVIFYPIGLLSMMLLARKYVDSKTAFVYGLLLSGTYYSFSMMQARPQALETLLFPVAIWSLLEGKTKTFIASVTGMFYLHSPICISLCLGLLFYVFRKNKLDIKFWATAFASAPMLFYQVLFVFNYAFINRWVSVGDLGLIKETAQFFGDPMFWLLNGVGISVLGFALAVFLSSRWTEQTTFTKLWLYIFVGIWVVFPIWYQRTFQFAIMPLSFFTAQFAIEQKGWLKILLYLLIAVQFLWFFLNPVWWMSKPDYLSQYW